MSTKLYPEYDVHDVVVDARNWFTNPAVTYKWVTHFLGNRTGVNMPGWKLRIKAAKSATTPFAADRYRTLIAEFDDYKVTWSSPSNPSIGIGSETGRGIQWPVQNIDHLSTNAAAVEAHALTKLYSRIRAEKSTLNTLNVLGELREAIHMMRRPAESFIKQLDRYTNSLGNQKREILRLPVHKRRAAWEKAVAGSVLEWNFGWAPFIADAKSAALALAKVVNEPPRRTRISAVATQEEALVTSTTKNSPNAASVMRYNNVVQTRTIRSVKYVVGMQARETGATGPVQRMVEQFGFTVENFIPTIYELTPWSWLADYFSNLGDIVEAATTDLSDVTWTCRTERVYTEKLSQCFPLQFTLVDNLGAKTRSVSGGVNVHQRSRSTVVRTIPSLGIPPLVLTHPGESFQKMANLVSVMISRRRGLEDLSYMPTYFTRKLAR